MSQNTKHWINSSSQAVQSMLTRHHTKPEGAMNRFDVRIESRITESVFLHSDPSHLQCSLALANEL